MDTLDITHKIIRTLCVLYKKGFICIFLQAAALVVRLVAALPEPLHTGDFMQSLRASLPSISSSVS